MRYPKDLTYSSIEGLSNMVAGKTIVSVQLVDEGIDSFIAFNFDDGETLFIRYDYLYDYQLMTGEI